MFAAAALVLSGLGIYGLLSFAVTQRRREIGIRLALGAAPSRIGRAIMGRAAAIALVGAVAGVFAAWGLTRYMESLLVEVTARDLTAFSIAPVAMFVCAIAAAALPVARAIGIDPNETMRL
jgi:putative ABC transport system permease protein